MYFAELDSYHKALENTATIALSVVTTSGAVVVSSSVPVASMSGMLADLEEFYGSKGPLMIWNKDSNELISIPYEQVASISIKLFSRRS